MNAKAKSFLKAALIRTLRTGIQSVLSMVTVGMGVFDVDWKTVISVSLVTMLVTFLTAVVTGLPEAGEAGVFIIDDSDPDKTQWTLQYDGDPSGLKPGDSVRFTIVGTNQNDGGEG